MKFAGQSKINDGVNTDGAQFMFIFTILEKIKKTRSRFSQESITVSQKMANYQEAKVELLICSEIKKNFQDQELPYEFFLTTRQITKIRNA